MKTLIQIVIAALLTLTALADDIRTMAEYGNMKPLPAADYVMVIEKQDEDTNIVVYRADDWSQAVAGGRISPDTVPITKDEMRATTLDFILKVAAHYNDGKAMFSIITDEVTPSKYKAYIQRLPPGKLEPIAKRSRI